MNVIYFIFYTSTELRSFQATSIFNSFIIILIDYINFIYYFDLSYALTILYICN